MQIALVRKLNSIAKGRAATSTVSVRAMDAQRTSISAFAQPVELLSCAGSCTWGGICTCAPHLTSLVPTRTPHLTSLVPSCAPRLTSLVPSYAPRLTSLVPACAPLLTPLHANGLGLGIGYCQ